MDGDRSRDAGQVMMHQTTGKNAAYVEIHK